MPEIDETGLAKFREIAAKNVKSSIIFAQIAKKEDIKPASNDVQNKLHELSAQLQVPMENLMQVYQDENMMANIESAITEEKVIEFIKEKANIVEELEQETKIDNDE
jgi:FKBP-type peptidyl-prolyl cis-trans isomerase (trigger factor)